MTNIQNIAREFDAMVPAIAEDYKAWVTRNLENLLAKYTGNQLSALGNSFLVEGGLWRQLRTFTYMVDENGERTTRYTRNYRIDHDAIERASVRYAKAQIDSFKAKLEKKMHDLEDVRDLQIGGLNFTFRGRKGDHDVRVEQSTVLKCSKNGTLFNQWPCRIYVDGKFMPESKFKQL